jgi:hypothetical protein
MNKKNEEIYLFAIVICNFIYRDGKGADRFAGIRSVIDAAIKNGQEVCPALSCLAKV